MSDTPAPVEAEIPSAYRAQPAAPAAARALWAPGEMGLVMKEQDLSIRSLFEAGVHYGHQPGRWNPLMRSYIFGERNGTHILDLDQTLPLLEEALDFLRDTTAAGGSVLFVGTKRQAAAPIMTRGAALEAVLREQPLARRHAHELEDRAEVDRPLQPESRDPGFRGQEGRALEEGARRGVAPDGEVREVARGHPQDGAAARARCS